MKNCNLLQFNKEVDTKKLTATFEDGTQLGAAYDFCIELSEYFRNCIQKQAQETVKKENEEFKELKTEDSEDE